MSESRDPVDLSTAARELVGQMESDATMRLDLAYQFLRGREQIEELRGELERERRRVDACVRAMSAGAERDEGFRGVLRRALPPLFFFMAGMVVLALILLLLTVADDVPLGVTALFGG